MGVCANTLPSSPMVRALIFRNSGTEDAIESPTEKRPALVLAPLQPKGWAGNSDNQLLSAAGSSN